MSPDYTLRRFCLAIACANIFLCCAAPPPYRCAIQRSARESDTYVLESERAVHPVAEVRQTTQNDAFPSAYFDRVFRYLTNSFSKKQFSVDAFDHKRQPRLVRAPSHDLGRAMRPTENTLFDILNSVGRTSPGHTHRSIIRS